LDFHVSSIEEPSAIEEDETMDDAEAQEQEEDIISLTAAPTSKKKSKVPLKRKRSTSSEDASSSDTELAAVSSAHSLTWSGLLAPSFISSLYARARALLASDASIPFVALTVFGFDEAITSWRDKQHQVWMGGAGGGGSEASGGGENHYTIILLPEAEQQRHQQQYVICTMLGELDRTH
jgi:hypothetical protein